MDAPLLQIVFGAGEDAGSLWLSRNCTYRSGPKVHPTAFIQEIPPDLICPFCSDVLLGPIAVEDGSSLCRHCAAATRGEMFAYSVPGDPGPAEQIQSLRVLCTFGFTVKPTGGGRFSITTDRKGGGHICLLRDRAAHELQCDFEPVACGLPGKLPRELKKKLDKHPPKCRHFVRRKALQDHRANCSFRVMQCPIEGCEEELQARGLRAHMNVCVYRRVSCLNRRGDNQCDWVGMHKDQTDHESECPYKIVQSGIPDTEMAGGSCQERFHRCDLPGHQKNCAYQKTRCTICNLEVSKRHIGVHEAHCDARWYQCPACGEKVHHKRRAQHYQTSCSMVAVKCEYAPYGCTAKPLKKDYMDHLKEAAGAHLQMVIAASGQGYEAVVQHHQRREAELARDVEVGMERVRDYEREADGLKVSIAQSAERHAGSAESLDRLVAEAGDRAATVSQALLEEVEAERSDFQERCFRSYTETQGLYRRVHQDTVPCDTLDSCCLEFDVAATASIEAHTMAEREVKSGRAVVRAVMEPTLSRLALMDLREDQLLQQLREKIRTTHALVTEKALACWRHLHTTGVPGRIEQIGRVQARLEHRLEKLEAGLYVTADEVLQLSQALKLKERLPEVVALKRLYTEVADSLEGGGQGGSHLLGAHIASEAPLFEIARAGEEGAGSETAGEGAVLNAIQLIENARWARRAAEDNLLRARDDLGAREARVAALEDQVTKLKDARYCLEQSDAHTPTLEYLEEILGLTRAYLARLQGEVSQGDETLRGLAQTLANEAREVTATEAEVAGLGDDLVATTDQPAVAALARTLAVDPQASAGATGGGGWEGPIGGATGASRSSPTWTRMTSSARTACTRSWGSRSTSTCRRWRTVWWRARRRSRSPSSASQT